MKFKFHLYVQKHRNRSYTVVPVPFWDLSAYGPNLVELKNELAEAVKARVEDMPPHRLQHVEFDSRLNLRTVPVTVRPLDRKKRKKRREQVQLLFSLLVKADEDKQLVVTVPRLGDPPLMFYAYNWDELESTAHTEIASWLDGDTLEKLQQYHQARSEFLDTFEVDIDIKKPKERATSDTRPRFELDEEQSNFWALKEVGINMTAQAAEQRFRRAYRREDAINAVLQILAGPHHNSVLVTGPAESGKTAVVHEIVRRLYNEDCAPALHEREVWMLTPDRIIAGAQFVGTWEERINNIVDECRQKRHILYVPDLPGLLEVGRWSKSDSNVGMALKPHIASGEVCIIGEASAERLTVAESLGPSFITLFRRVDIGGMSEEETLSMLPNVTRDLERELDVRILPEAIQASVGLSRRFWPYRAFPGKAIRLVEETAADATRLQSDPPRGTSSRLHRVRNVRISRQDVIAAFSRFSGLPEFIVNDEARMSVREVENYFQERILGQQDAVRAVVDLMAMVKAGLNDPHKPLGTFLFIGPTGVGKTQMAKTMAEYLFGDANRLIRFDMSEYTDIDGVTRLIGAFDREGELTRQVREQPFSVVLLDEFEKASPRIYDIFLQVLGEGRLTDAAGKTTLFHNAIVILTSNLGGGSKAFRAPGFDVGGQHADPTHINHHLHEHYLQQVEQYFRPEFVNRLDKIVVFGLLSPDAVRDIARRELTDVLQRDGVTRRNLLVEFDESVIDLVLERGYSPEYGARPLKREIDRRVVVPMARQLAQRSSSDQHLLRVLVEHGTLTLKSVPIDEAAKSTVTLGANGTGRKEKLTLDELVEGFALLRRRLSDWAESDIVKGMQREKSVLLSSTHTPEFWDNEDRAGQKMRRFYFLDRLTRRLRQLTERAEYLEDVALLVNRERDISYQSELAKDYEKLYHDVEFLDIEMLTARLPHRNQAMMLITMLGTQSTLPLTPHHAWMRRLSEMYLWWAEYKGYDREIYLLTPDESAPGGKAFVHLRAGSFKDAMRRFAAYDHTDEIALWFEGSNVFGFLKGERGLHRLLTDKPHGEDLARVQVFALPDGTKVPQWLADYQRIKTDITEGRQPQPAQERHSVIRSYSLDRDQTFVRDQRTNVRVSNVKDVMQKGQLDPFILAHLHAEESRVNWEDRYPPTFPF